MTLQTKHSYDAVFDSQKTYRLMLEAMSNPTRIVDISQMLPKFSASTGIHAAFLAVAMTLLDNEVSFCAYKNPSLSDEIASLTLAATASVETADYLFVSNSNDIHSVIWYAKCGTLSDPHKSATVIIENDSMPDCELTFYGPGINGSATVQTTQTVKEAIIRRDAREYEYPEGVDLIFVSSVGEMFAIPRLVRYLVHCDE